MDLKIFIKDRKSKKRNGVQSILGQIEIGDDFKETLYMPLDLWSTQNYIKQWQEGIEHLKTHSNSCLIVTIHDPLIRPFIEWWILYKIGKKIYVRNQMLFGEIYEDLIGKKLFDHQTCYDFIHQRDLEEEKDYEYPVSEWVVDNVYYDSSETESSDEQLKNEGEDSEELDDSYGVPAYSKGHSFIMPYGYDKSVDWHWKVFERGKGRIGSWDRNLNERLEN